jgi:hypothetical protein
MASAAPPTEYFESIHFNLSFYTEGDNSVTLNYVNNIFLKCVGYAYSRAISTSFNGIVYALGGINQAARYFCTCPPITVVIARHKTMSRLRSS